MQTKDIQNLLPDNPPENFCIAPFQSTRQNPYGRTSPCAFGAGEWRFEDLTPLQRWNSKPLNDLRHEFIKGNKPDACFRCWAEEDAGKQSLRQRQLEYFPTDYEDFIKTGDWLDGPRTAVLKVSNVCNLACRSCGPHDSNQFAEEGKHYERVYNVGDRPSTGNRFFVEKTPQHIKASEFIPISKNLKKIDFYGGEPFLNVSHLELLEAMENPQDTTLFYSTNCTNMPTTRLKRAWNKFKKIEISLSVDGTQERFEFLRHPGKWNKALKVIDTIDNLQNELDCEVYVMGSLTVSAMNVLDVDNIYSWHKDRGDVYINMVQSPAYMSISRMPDHIKQVVRDNITNSEVLGYLDVETIDPTLWEQFKIWTTRQDLYRNESLRQVFPKIYYLMYERNYDE
jgi:sulfatase maturation enzyme AslB (radical SAM superfamily)